MQKDRYEIIMAGSGGQGLVVAGIMLGEAAILEGKNVVQTQSYGIASRGGFSMAELIIDREEIIFQHVLRPDVILTLTSDALDKMIHHVKDENTPVFYDTTLIEKLPQSVKRFIGHPFTRLAGDLGQVGAVNIVALGAIIAMTGVVKPESMVKLINERFKPEVAQINLRALDIGLHLSQSIH